MCQQGITRKVWIPGPRGLKPPPRNDTQWVFELTTPGTPAGYNAKMPKAARTGDGRRWLQPPFLGISGQGDTISGGFNRRLKIGIALRHQITANYLRFSGPCNLPTRTAKGFGGQILKITAPPPPEEGNRPGIGSGRKERGQVPGAGGKRGQAG